MSKQLQTLSGFKDILWPESAKWQVVESIARNVAEDYGFSEIRTPVLEASEVFHRGVGESNDLVQKETYTFNDRDKRSVTLRPEGTASAARAVIQAGLLNDQGSRVKVYYFATNFRHEKKAAHRYRQHTQFGVEALGVASPEQDAECILLQMEFYRRCGVRELSLNINSMGDRESKNRYREALVAYLKPLAGTLSEDSQRRLETNPLRILDSKDERDQSACEGAPPANDYLSDKSRLHFERVLQLLTGANIHYAVTSRLVRGFDYYTETLWEVTATGLGAQSAIGGGGRYDNLVESLGGNPNPGVGFGAGIERLLAALENQGVVLPEQRKPLIWLAAHGEAAVNFNLQLIQQLRQAGFRADMDLSGRAMKGQMKMSEKEKADWAIIVGDDELKNSTVMLKDLAKREQSSVAVSELIEKLKTLVKRFV